MENLEYLITIAAAWVLAQGIKSVISTAKNKNFHLSYLMESGGMPSAHSAFVMSLTTLLALSEGIFTPLFALSAAVSVVVMYDAMKVRYSVGKQADAINALISGQRSKVAPVKVICGHTALEVFFGACIGILVALVVFYTTQNL